MGIPPISFQLRDFTTPEGVAVVNDWIEKLTLAVNTLAGLHGTVVIASPIDMQGHPITNVGTSTEPSSVVTQQAAQQVFGPAAIQPQLDAMGNNILQTTRRLNDQLQREQFSTYLNAILNVPPGSNSSTVTVTSIGGGQTQVAIAAGTYTFADRSVVPYAARTDTFTNPGVGSNTYYYYLRKSDNTIQFSGPFTSATSNAALQASFDGRGFVAKAVVNAGGGGTGGGGGDPGGGGCLEVGTPFHIPYGKKWTMVVEPCDKWVVVNIVDGRKIVAAYDTRIAVFKRVQDLDSGDEFTDESGMYVLVTGVDFEDRPSFKMKMKVEGGVYSANGIWGIHNTKIQP